MTSEEVFSAGTDKFTVSPKPIDSGTFANIFLARKVDSRHDQPSAVLRKGIVGDDYDARVEEQSQYALSEQGLHPKLFGSTIYPTPNPESKERVLVSVMEKGTSYFDYLSTYKLTIQQLQFLAASAVKTLCGVAAMGLLLGDCKPQNMVVTEDLQVKMIDVGPNLGKEYFTNYMDETWRTLISLHCRHDKNSPEVCDKARCCITYFMLLLLYNTTKLFIRNFNGQYTAFLFKKILSNSYIPLQDLVVLNKEHFVPPQKIPMLDTVCYLFCHYGSGDDTIKTMCGKELPSYEKFVNYLYTNNLIRRHWAGRKCEFVFDGIPCSDGKICGKDTSGVFQSYQKREYPCALPGNITLYHASGKPKHSFMIPKLIFHKKRQQRNNKQVERRLHSKNSFRLV